MNISSFYKAAAVLGVLTLFACVFVSYAEETANSGKGVFADYDQDGLSNDEEAAYGTDPYKADTDGDGYSDYVEISSGYDPKKPAPGDRIVKEPETAIVLEDSLNGNEKNLTQEVATKLAGVMQASASQGQTLTLADIDKVVNDSVETSVQAPKMPEVDIKRIKIKDESYKNLSEDQRKEKVKEDVQKYMSSVGYILAVQFPELFSGGKSDPKMLADNMLTRILVGFTSGDEKEINAISEAGAKATEQMYEVEVPDSLIDLHMRGLQFSLYAQEMKKSIKIQASDPLESISNLSLAQGFIASASELFSDSKDRLAELGIDSINVDIANSEDSKE